MPAVSCRSRALTRRVSALVAIALLGAGSLFAVARPASAVNGLGITSFRTMEVDPATGHVFIEGDGKIFVLDADGSLMTTVNGLEGASGMTLDGTNLWVVEGSGAISRFDTQTLTRTERFTTGVATSGAIAVVGGDVWFLGVAQNYSAQTPLWLLDPDSGDVTSRGFVWYGAQLAAVPGQPGRLLAGDGGISAFSAYVLDVTTNPVTVLADTDLSSGSLREMAVTDHGTFVTASGAPYNFPEFSLSPDGYAMRPVRSYPGDAYPHAVAYSPAKGGLVAGAISSHTDQLFIARWGITASTHEFDLVGDSTPGGVGIAADGSRAYAVTRQSDGGEWSLSVFDLAPQLEEVSPQWSVTADQVKLPDDLYLRGVGLGGATAVRVDGDEVSFDSISGDLLKVHLPTVPNGSHTVDVVTAWGTTPALGFDVVAQPGPPTVTALSPSSGSTAGGTPVLVGGENFVDIRSVRLGDTPVPYEARSSYGIVVTTPAHLPASAPLIVETDHGTSTAGLEFTWVAAFPEASLVTPSTGTSLGGTPVTIKGSGFTFVSRVAFDGTDASSFEVVNDTTITALTPAHAAGATNITVTTPGGTSGPRTGSVFTFSSAPPSVTAMSPAWALAGTTPTVQITGAGFIGTSSVTAGGTSVAFSVLSDSSVSVALPAHSPGTVDVVVTTPNGDSQPKQFAYIDPPSDRPRVGSSESITPPSGAYSFPGDFNGDGIDDVLWYGAGTVPDAMWTFAADGTFTSKSIAMGGTYRPVIGDFAGDGVDDIFWYAAGTTADYLQNIKPGGPPTFTRIDVNGTFQPLVGDFTGDEVDDIFWYAPGTAPDSLWDFNSGGAHTAKALAVTPRYRPVAGDFSGDGIDDIFWYVPGTGADYLQNFKPNGAPSTFTRVDVNGTFRPFAGDFTGDGVDDVFWYAPGTTADSIWDFNAGGGHSSSSMPRSDFAVPSVGDFTGGGVDDIVWSTSASSAIWFLSPVVR